MAGAKPSTIGVDLNLIRTVLEAAKEANIASLDLEVIYEARRRCRRDGLTGNGDKSERRITDNELKDLEDYFSRENGRMELPMWDLMWFALHSTRRVSEICRLEWHDNDPSNQSGLVHDALQPHEPTAIHKRFRMTREAQDSSWNFRQTPAVRTAPLHRKLIPWQCSEFAPPCIVYSDFPRFAAHMRSIPPPLKHRTSSRQKSAIAAC